MLADSGRAADLSGLRRVIVEQAADAFFGAEEQEDIVLFKRAGGFGDADDFFNLRDRRADGGAAFAAKHGDEVEFVTSAQVDIAQGFADKARREIDLDDLMTFADLEAIDDIWGTQ